MITTDLDRYEFTQANSENYKVEVKSGEGLRIRVRREPAESS